MRFRHRDNIISHQYYNGYSISIIIENLELTFTT